MNRPIVQLVLALMSVGVLLSLWALRGPHDRVRGDEGTYLAMAESLARDGDLWFEASDQARTEASPFPGRRAVILQRVGERVAYSKPILYPVLAAPFFALMGARGLVVLNVVAVAVAVGFLVAFLRRTWPTVAVLSTVFAFTGLGLLLPYIPWRTSDALQAALTIVGLALCLWDSRASGEEEMESGRGTQDRRRIIGAVLLGALVSMRLTNGPLAVIPVAALWLNGRRRPAVITALVLAATVGVGAAATRAAAGAPSPYLAVRATFTPQTGYPAETGLVGLQSPFDSDRAQYNETKKIIEAPLASLYGAGYFFVGRHTGIAWYYPFALFLVLSALRRPDRTTWVVLAAVAGLAAFYLVFIPFYYFGGATCVGNRYFLVSYAALPFALVRPPGRKLLLAAWVLGALVAVSAAVSILGTGERDRSTQNHAFAGLFRLAPFESTVAGIDGVRDVYWELDFGRFVDPFVAVGDWRFRLSSQDPPAEIELANLKPEAPLRLHVLSAAPRLELLYSDYAQRLRIPLEAPMGERGLIEIQPSRPWRYHPLWFRNLWDHGLPYHVRIFRLAIRTPDDRPAVAEIRYLGDVPWPREAFSRRIEALELPQQGIAGNESELSVAIENTSSVEWAQEGPFPVLLSYRLAAEDGSRTLEGPRVPIGQVGPGKEVRQQLEITWPQEAGQYRLTVDLLIEGVAWYEERVGQPLAEGVVEIVPALREAA